MISELYWKSKLKQRNLDDKARYEILKLTKEKITISFCVSMEDLVNAEIDT